MYFWPKKHFSAKRKNGDFSVIPALTGSVVIVGHFFYCPASSTKFGHFWPIWSHAQPKNNANKVPRWFFVMWVPKLLLPLVRIKIFGPKTIKFGLNLAFLVILGHILAFLAHFVPRRTKKTMRTRCLGGFYVLWVPKLLLSLVW